MKKNVKVLFFCVLCMSFPKVGIVNSAAVNSSKPSSLNSGLVGYWTFDGKDMIPNVRDVSGRGNHGYIQGQTATTTVLGKLGQALVLDGSDDYISVSNESQFDFERTDPFSISLWVKFSNNSTNGTLFAKQLNGGNFPGINFYIDGTNRRAYFILVSVDGGGNSLNVSTSMNSLNRDTWTHVFVTYDGSSSAGGVKIYFNGVSQSLTVGVNSLTSSILNNTSPTFGRNLSSAGSTLKGSIDDARVYNRELSENEVKSIYRGGSLRSGVSRSVDALSNGLVAHWTLDGSKTLTNVFDSSGNGNHMRFVGSKGTTTVPGKIGQGLQFDRSNGDYLTTQSTINMTSVNIASVSLWLYVDEFNNNDHLGIESSTNSNNNDGSVGFDPNSGSPCSGYVSVSIQDGSTANKYRVECFNRPSAKEWHHYVMIYDNSTPSGDTRLFINGVEQSTASLAVNTKNQTSGLGNYTWYFMSRAGTSLFASGRVDDIRIYSRALSDSEIKSLYNLSAGTKTNTSLSQKNVNSNGLVGHWTFDGSKMISNVADSSGNNNHGYLQGQTSTTTRLGKLGQALSLDGVNDYVSTGLTANFDNGLTIVGWMKPIVTGDGTIMASGNSGNAGNWAFKFQFGNRLYFAKDGATDLVARTGAQLSVNEWQHVAMTWNGGSDASADVIFYKNGSILSHDIDTDGITLVSDSGWQKFIGARTNVLQLFEGLLDDLRIYNRVLSQNEILQMYNATK